MSIKSKIVGNSNGYIADVINQDDNNALVVSTLERKKFNPITTYFYNPVYGINMNNNFSSDFVASIEDVHNGGDNNYWDASSIIGNNFNFNSTDVSYNGLYSIKVRSKDGDVMQFKNQSIIEKDKYSIFEGYLYIDSNWNVGSTDGCNIYLYNTSLGIIVSENLVRLNNYINENNKGSWQKFSISFDDFGIISNDYDAIRIEVTNTGKTSRFYFDDFKLIELISNSKTYSLKPSNNKKWYVDSFQINLVSQYIPNSVNGNMYNLSYNDILGLNLQNGVYYQRRQRDNILFSYVIKNLMDILSIPRTKITNIGTDGNNTFFTVLFDFSNKPFVLDSKYEDGLSFFFYDDLSSFLFFTISADVREEYKDGD